MSSTALKMTAAIMVLLAVILGAVTVKVYSRNAERAQQAADRVAEQEKSPQILAVVAAKPLAAYRAIERDAVKLVPVAVAPAKYYTRLDDAIGKLPLVDIEAGTPITERYFKEGNVLARAIPAGHEAVSVEVNDVIAVGGFLRPGDVVDVLVFLRSNSGLEQPQARVLLNQVRLLAYEERIIDQPEGLQNAEGGEQKQQRRARTAVLAVPQADTTRLMLGASLGELRLALHSASDVPAEAKPAADKTITLAELSRRGPAPADKSVRPRPAPSVEIYRGSQRERVITRN